MQRWGKEGGWEGEERGKGTTGAYLLNRKPSIAVLQESMPLAGGRVGYIFCLTDVAAG